MFAPAPVCYFCKQVLLRSYSGHGGAPSDQTSPDAPSLSCPAPTHTHFAKLCTETSRRAGVVITSVAHCEISRGEAAVRDKAKVPTPDPKP